MLSALACWGLRLVDAAGGGVRATRSRIRKQVLQDHPAMTATP
jgi:hypothetical protein